MSKTGKNIIKGAREALTYTKGKSAGTTTHKALVPKQVNVRAIRNQ